MDCVMGAFGIVGCVFVEMMFWRRWCRTWCYFN